MVCRRAASNRAISKRNHSGLQKVRTKSEVAALLQDPVATPAATPKAADEVLFTHTP